MPATYARRTLSVAEMPKTVLAPLQVFRIGPVCIASMPCEVFCEIGLEFKKRSAVQPAFMVELAHDSLGYLPTPRHFELGGYETWLGTSRMEPQASEKMLAAVLEMTAEVKDPAQLP
jgi:neutral ceramidase